MRTVIITIPFLLFFACGPECKNENAIASTPVSIEVERLEAAFFSQDSPEGIENLLEEYREFSRLFLDSDQYPTDSILAAKIFRLIQNPSIDTLYNEAVSEYSDFDPIREDLEMAIGKMATLFPETRVPKIQTTVSGLYKDLFISDSLILIGLDFFIGPEATYKPLEIPGYVLKRYNKEHLASIIVKFLAGNQVYKGKSSSLLSEMVDFGKTYYLASRLVPCTQDSVWLGYTSRDMEVIDENEAVIWANLLENEVLYETNHITKRRFLGERPNVYEISQECPGRIGAWVGWRIVESYMKNNEVSIEELLADTDNEKIFRLSGYKPQSR